ncbi:hypothetical protein MHYP_G00161930 [Metynnis hypsauchen]
MLMISPRMASGMQEKQYTPSLLSFFIYNPKFGPREGEEEKKILFYHPSEVEKNEKIRNVGLCEAIVQFTRTFCPTKPAKSLHTQKNRQFFHEPEDNFWMVMIVRNPMIEKPSKDGKPATIEYQEEEILDSVYGAVLRQCYSMYKLFNGTFSRAFEAGGVELLRQKLEKFFYRYLQTLHLQSCDLLDVFGGISFFPLDKMTYLKIQSFVNRVEESLSLVKYTAFLYNDQLIWSGLEQDDMRILYKYLTTSLFPRHTEPELAGRDSPLRPEVAGNLLHYGRFLTGPANLKDPEAKFRFPRIFVNTEDSYEELHLIVYKAMSAAVCFMINASVELTREFCEQLDALVGPQLTLLASDICEQYNINRRISGPEKEPQFKFIYFNHMNLAEKSTIHMRKTASVSLTSVHPDLMKILGDINCDFARVDEDEEIIVKAMTDYWVVGKKSDQRELYVILNQKNANLIEVNEEVKRLYGQNTSYSMDSRFAHLYKRDSSVSMIRVKMSRRRSQTQKENRERVQNQRRHLDQLPELELSMDVSTLEKSVVHAQGTGCKKKADKCNSAAEERKKMLERFKENKTLQKEKEKREKEKKGVFKVGLYRPQPLGYLPLNPVVPSTAKNTETTQFTRVTRSMKQQQQQQQLKLPTEKQAAPKKAEHAPSARVNKPAAKPSGRGRTDAAEPVARAPTTRSAAKTSAAAVPAKAAIKPASDLRALKTRSANRQPTALSAGRGKPMQAEDTASVPAVERTEFTVNPSPVKEKKVEEAKVTPTSFAPQGFVFQPPSGLRSFQPTPLSPSSADAFLSPSFCFESKTESTILALPSSESFAATAAPPLSSFPSCSSNAAPAPVAPSSPPPSVSSPLLPASTSPVSAPVEPQHDVSYFRAVMADETKRLTGLSEMWELRFDDASIPEEMRDRMRTAVGQARLLMKERFGQFSGLVDDCDLGRGEKITTCSDLQGFWDMVYFQVEDVNKKFSTLKEAEARGWQEETKPVTKQKKVVRKPPVAGGKTGAGSGASTAAKSRLAAVKAAMKAKAAAEKAAVASNDTASASDAPANPLATQTVIFHGGFFQVESPVKVVDSPRIRLSAAPLPQSSPFVSKFNTPCRQKRSALSYSSPIPRMTLTSTEVASPTANPVQVPHPAAYHTCTPQRPAEPLPCSPQPLQISPEHHRPSLQASPTGVSHTESTQPDHDTSDDTSQIQSDLANAPIDSPMQESTEIKPQISPCQSEAELPLCLPENTDISPEPEGCIQESNAVTALSQEQAEAPMLTELNGSALVCTAAGASPVKAHTQSFTLSPSPSKTASPQAQMAERLVSSPSGPLMMSISPPQVCVLSPAPSDSAIIPVNERSSICAKVEMTENPGAKNIAELDFERYLQPTARCSLSPLQSMAAERFSLGAADAEMESPRSQAEDSVQDVIMTPTALHRMAPLVFTPWTEQLTDNPLPFTPEQRDRVRQSVCDRDLMMFTPPSSK